MTKRILLALLFCFPLMSLAQVKSGIPISEVVRQAQVEAAAQKNRSANKANQQNVRTQQQTPTTNNDPYNPNDVDLGIIKESKPQRIRAEKIAKPVRNMDFDDQLDFSNKFGLSLSTNGLMWLATIPNLDLHLKYDKFSIVASVGYSAWNMPDQKFWWVTSIGGEFRYDILPNVYIGALYNWFNYNIKLGNTGNQGLTQSMGIVAGYKLPIGRKLALDFGLGLGYALVDNEKYHAEGTVFKSDSRRTFGYWGPIKAQISLVWRIL